MKKIKTQLAMLAGLLLSTSAANAGDVGVHVVLEGDVAPGVYGRVELGKESHPDLVYSEPRVVVVEEKYRRYKPVYLHVPPGHAKHWDKHCREYNACNRKVYFVKSAEYSPEYRHEHNDHEHSKKKHKEHDKNKNH